MFLFFITLLLFAVLDLTSSLCTFRQIIISKTTEFDDNCTDLIGRVRIDETTGLTDDELSVLFKNIRSINGVLQVWNTSLTKITFTTKFKEVSGDPLDKTISIMNNTKLTSLNISSLATVNGIVQITNNPVLDLKPNCDRLHEAYFTDRQISGNKFDCGCDIRNVIHYLDYDIPSDCFVVYGMLYFSRSHPPIEMLNRLRTVQKLYGTLTVEFTNLETLGFLENLVEIQSGIESELTVNIHNNDYLGRLDMINFKKVSSKNPESKLDISGNSGLCFDPESLQTIIRSEMKTFISQNKGFCDLTKINNPGTYCTGKLSSVDDLCTQYIGNIIYQNPDWKYYQTELYNLTRIPETDMKKIQQFEFIFGTIYIEASDLTEFVLPYLKEIYQVESLYFTNLMITYYETIRLYHNNLLEKIEFPKLKYAYSKIHLESNLNLTTDGNLCRSIVTGMNPDFYISYDNSDCRWYMDVDEETTISPEIEETTTSVGSS